MDLHFTKEEKFDFFKIMEIAYQHFYLPIINCAFELRLFDYLTGFKTCRQVAHEAQVEENELIFLLNSLVALDILEKRNDLYSMKHGLKRFLDSRSETFIGLYHETIYYTYKKIVDFTSILKTGLHSVKKEKSPEFFSELVKMMFYTNIVPASELAEHFEGEIRALRKRKGIVHILDVGAGSGVWSIPFCKLNNQVFVDAFDFERVLDVTREFVKRHDVADRYAFIKGDIDASQWHLNKYDYILLGNICNTVSMNSLKLMFKNARNALSDCGKVVVIDMVPDEYDLKKTIFPVIFSILMRLITSEGATHTVNEYTELMSEAGFKKFGVVELTSYHSKILLAE